MGIRQIRAGGLILVALLLAALGVALAIRPAAPSTRMVPPVPREAGEVLPLVPGSGGLEDESGDLEALAAYWHERLTYPTGQFDPAWRLAAVAQDAQMARGVPAGRVIYDRTASRSPLGLDPTRFTSLGPRPLNWYIGATGGRTNVVVVDPVTPNVAYIGVAGGGVWKSSNCCSPVTSWVPVTDGPLISTIGIGDLTLDPQNHNVVYAGTGDLNYTLPEYGSAGILRSTDAGSTWSVLGATVFQPPYPQPVGNPYPEDQAIGKVRVDPRDSSHIVAGTKTGLFFSYDAGANWTGPCYTNAYTSTQRQEVTGLLLRDTGTATEMYVAQGTRGFALSIQPGMGNNGANGIYRATLPASGCPASWSLLSRPDNGWPAGTGSGIPVGQGGNVLGRIDLAFAPSTIGPGSSNVTLYAQVQSTQNVNGQYIGGQLGVWRTTDGGITWQQRSNQTALVPCAGSPYGDFPQNWFDQAVAVDPANPDRVLIDTFDLWQSTDGGSTFTDLTCGYSTTAQAHPDHHAIVFVPGTPTSLVAGTDGGVYVSTDSGQTWSEVNDSLSTLEFYSGDISPDFANAAQPAAAGGMQDNGSAYMQWTGAPGQAAWQMALGGDGFWSRIEPVQQQRWYVESNTGRLFMSSSGPGGFYNEITGGWRFARKSIILPYELYKYDCPPTGCTHMIAGTTSVSETLTGDASWLQISPNFSGTINQLSYAVSLSTTAILGMSDGKVEYGFGLGQGVAATWVDVSGNNQVLPNRPILDVTTDPLDPLIGYAAVGGFDENTPTTPGHVFQVVCTPNCATATWLDKSGNLPDSPVNTILANPRFPQQVFAGGDWGLYYTDDITANPPTWYRFQAGLPNVQIWDMQIDAGFTTLSLWTRSRGAFAWPLPAAPLGPPASPTPAPPATETPVVPTASPTPPATATQPATATPPAATATLPPPTAPPSATRTAAASPTGTPCSLGFSDVQPTDYFYTPVQYLVCRGVVSGYGDGTFRPYANTTRGQLAKIVVGAEGWAIDTSGGPHFSDVPPAHPFYAYIETAYHRGIIGGYGDGTFRAYADVTRGQLSKIIVGAEGWALDTSGGPHFSDVPEGSPFYAVIETALHHGIISGYGDGTFRWGNPATRGQISKIVYLAVTASGPER